MYKTLLLVRIYPLISAPTKSFAFFSGNLICKRNNLSVRIRKRFDRMYCVEIENTLGILKSEPGLMFILTLVVAEIGCRTDKEHKS